MAEEYIGAAHGMGPLAALSQREADSERYYKLMATGLGCMESVLKVGYKCITRRAMLSKLQNFRLHPRMEATLRLRYAELLSDETENYMEAETVLSKGVRLF